MGLSAKFGPPEVALGTRPLPSTAYPRTLHRPILVRSFCLSDNNCGVYIFRVTIAKLVASKILLHVPIKA